MVVNALMVQIKAIFFKFSKISERKCKYSSNKFVPFSMISSYSGRTVNEHVYKDLTRNQDFDLQIADLKRNLLALN